MPQAGPDPDVNPDPKIDPDPEPYDTSDAAEPVTIDVGLRNSRFLEEPVDSAVVRPTADDVAESRKAFVRSRLAKIHSSSHKTVTAAVTGVGSAIAEVQAAQARFALTQRAVRYAELESGTVRALPPPPGGLRYEPHSRALGRFAMTTILGVCLFGDFLVDRGSLLVFRLAFGFTETLALLTAVIQTFSAHTVGRLIRRLKEAIDPDEMSHERWKMHLLISLITVVVIALALVRAARGNFLLAALVLGVGGSSALVAVTVSYLHANTRLDAIEDTDHKIRNAGNKAADRGRDLLQAEAKRVGAVSKLQATADDVVARIDLVYKNYGVQPSDNEPAWIRQLRDWASGQHLPSTSGQP